jgi:rare lipoprotein A (peptidoglycan hydrolase)
MEDSVKVERKRGFGLNTVATATTGLAVAVTLLVGAGIVPATVASAQVTEVGIPGSLSGSVLPPAAEQPKAEDLRQPSGLGAAEAKASGVRTPTAIKPKPAPKSAPKPAAPKRQTPATSAASAVDTTGWKSAKVSWYGPGFYGNTMAGGGKLTPSSMVVAHRSLPFGTKIEFSYKGRTCTAVVQDRGPHVAGRVFDLGPGTAGALGFSGVGTVKYRIL